jgi:hypothetical protein
LIENTHPNGSAPRNMAMYLDVSNNYLGVCYKPEDSKEITFIDKGCVPYTMT